MLTKCLLKIEPYNVMTQYVRMHEATLKICSSLHVLLNYPYVYIYIYIYTPIEPDIQRFTVRRFHHHFVLQPPRQALASMLSSEARLGSIVVVLIQGSGLTYGLYGDMLGSGLPSFSPDDSMLGYMFGSQLCVGLGFIVYRGAKCRAVS